MLRNKDVVEVAAGMLHTLASTREGELYSWGCALNGRLGHTEVYNNLAQEPRVVPGAKVLVVEVPDVP